MRDAIGRIAVLAVIVGATTALAAAPASSPVPGPPAEPAPAPAPKGIVGAAAAAPADAPGRLLISERFEYYRVDATTRHALKQQLDEAMSRIGGDKVGRTEQSLRSSYELVATPSGCRFQDLVVSLDITIHLPEWRPEGKRPYKLGKRWDAMIAALALHEEGHRDLAVDAAHYLLAQLRAIAGDLDCKAMRRAAGKAFLDARLRHGILDGAYERRTRHGIAQGATL